MEYNQNILKEILISRSELWENILEVFPQQTSFSDIRVGFIYIRYDNVVLSNSTYINLNEYQNKLKEKREEKINIIINGQ